MKNSIIETLTNLGYSNKGDNRNYIIRSLNTLLDTGVISLKIQECDSDGCFLRKDKKATQYIATVFGKKYYGHIVYFRKRMNGEIIKIKHETVDLFEMLCHLARIISKNRSGFDFLKDNNCDCAKCNGKGIIPQFLYYADGICFDCGGTGVDRLTLKRYILSTIK